MLGGVVLVAVIVIIIMQGSASGANNALNTSASSYGSFITTGVENVLTTGSVNGASLVKLTCTAGTDTSDMISNNVNCNSACQAAGYSSGTTVCAVPGCSASCKNCRQISCYGTAWNIITDDCSKPGSCKIDNCYCSP